MKRSENLSTVERNRAALNEERQLAYEAMLRETRTLERRYGATPSIKYRLHILRSLPGRTCTISRDGSYVITDSSDKDKATFTITREGGKITVKQSGIVYPKDEAHAHALAADYLSSYQELDRRARKALGIQDSYNTTIKLAQERKIPLPKRK